MLVISLTSIPPRFSTLPKMIAALWAQKWRPDRILLTIPQSYRRFPGPFTLPALPKVEVLRPKTDSGPAGKVLHAAKALQGQNCSLLYCDDDWLYHPDWSVEFLTAAKARPVPSVLCASGFDVDRLGQHRGRLDPRGDRTSQGYVDVAQGFGGVMIRPEWLRTAPKQVPGPLWPVDDIWLSGLFAGAGVPIWKQASLRNLMVPLADPGNLQDARVDGIDRSTANRSAARYLTGKYGIWSEKSPAP